MSDYAANIRRAGLRAEAHERELKLQQQRKERIAAEAAEAPESIPKQSERPSKRAQWDELAGQWVEWDGDAGDWRVVPTDRPIEGQPDRETD